MTTSLSLLLSLILLVNLEHATTSTTRDVDVIYLHFQNSTNNAEIPIAFTAFGQAIQLQLQRNDHLLAPYFQVWRHDGSEIIKEIPELSKTRSCHYLHQDVLSTAAISLCDEGIHGLILFDNVTLEITPMDKNDWVLFGSVQSEEKIPHIVKRSYIERILSSYSKPMKWHLNYLNDKNNDLFDIMRSRRKSTEELTVELAVFFDEPGYQLFLPFFDKDEKKMRDMLLAYINAIQALFYHPSLGTRINIALVRLDMMKKQPKTLPHFNGERMKLLNSFCNYTATNNPPDDDHPNHWDVGLYVSGLDFYAVENGKKNGVTMGLATVSGACIRQYACVIAELGVTDRMGKPYPSAGFTSVYIAAHEIGHNLGMHHDSTGNSCSRDGYIMSPSRGTQGETLWSSCSRQVAIDLPTKKPCLLDKTPSISDKHLNHIKFLTLPGREWTAKRQCELLLRDKDANFVTLENACQSLKCQSPHRSGYYFSGPALDGTVCQKGKECRGGECLPASYFLKPKPPLSINNNNSNSGWSKWREESCKSGCIKKSKGAQARRRSCSNNNYLQINELKGGNCQGFMYDVKLCEDEKLCKKRITVEEFGTMKCREFSEHLPELDKNGMGLQAPHEIERPWMACAIFCRRTDIASYYTPRIELNDLGLDPYYPDGTWCHNEHNEDYFCLQHHCLPNSFRFAKDGLFKRNNNTDMKLGPQNAHRDGYKIPDAIIRYLSLGIDGLPLSKNFPDDNVTPPINDDEWEDIDYVELPQDVF
ncbi:hypothetical protein PV325_004374 [Microctonus aethiopoides]|uniref:Peptidase M12B domain-containing protein n=1 Tax=Microctonus aethiopoides TaxID=144406 RepID=A0AA39FYE0_9HYME|nr:hypothetical protein PV325_004374 [Microctonus aethiopoides]KAK0177811.1 hypothetical protein PV328_001821 [Microctonus aethiopoides]